MSQETSVLADAPGHEMTSLADEIDLDLRITIAPEPEQVGQPKMDGYTTYTSCHYTCPFTCVWPDSGCLG